MGRKKETITLSIPPGTKEKLERIAAELDIKWGDRPSISGLFVALAEGEVKAERSSKLTKVQLQSLDEAINALVDVGKMEEANTLIQLLLEKGNLETPLNQELIRKIDQQGEAWRKQVDQYIHEKQSFHMVYFNSQEQLEDFNVCYGEIALHEKRLYLDAWCQETKPNIAGLEHNICFRLDRIKHIIKCNYKWREEGLTSLEVQLHFYKRMIKAYQSKPEDVHSEIENDKRVVIRKVTNTFWLFREILPYGKNCEIVSPPIVRDKFIEELTNINSLYSF